MQKNDNDSLRYEKEIFLTLHLNTNLFFTVKIKAITAKGGKIDE